MEPGDDHSKTLVKSTMREQLCRGMLSTRIWKYEHAGVNHQLQMYLNHDHDDCLDSASIVLTIALERAINKLESSAQILWDAGEKISMVLKQAECLIIYQQDKLFDIYKRFEKDLERCLKIPLPAVSIGKNKLRSFSASFRILHAAVIILSMNNIPDDVESNYLVAIYARLKQEVDQYLQEWSAQNDFLLQSQFKLDATEAPDNLDLLQKYVLEEDAQANSEYLKRYRDMGVIHSPTGMHQPWAKQVEAVKSEKQGMLKAKPKCRTEQDYVLEDDSEYRRRYRDLGAIHAPTEMQLAKKEAEESCVYKQGMWKTELCNKWKETGICPYGDNCRFAHGNKELRQVERHPRYKAELCRYVLNGAICPFAHRCHFRHTFTYKEKLVRAASLQPPR